MFGLLYALASAVGLLADSAKDSMEKEAGKAEYKKNPDDFGVYWGRGNKQYDINTNREVFVHVDPKTGHMCVWDAKKGYMIRDPQAIKERRAERQRIESGANMIERAHSKFESKFRSYDTLRKKVYTPLNSNEEYYIKQISAREIADKVPESEKYFDKNKTYGFVDDHERRRWYYVNVETGMMWKCTDACLLKDIKMGEVEIWKEIDKKFIEKYNENKLKYKSVFEPFEAITFKHSGVWYDGEKAESELTPEDYRIIREQR